LRREWGAGSCLKDPGPRLKEAVLPKGMEFSGSSLGVRLPKEVKAVLEGE